MEEHRTQKAINNSPTASLQPNWWDRHGVREQWGVWEFAKTAELKEQPQLYQAPSKQLQWHPIGIIWMKPAVPPNVFRNHLDDGTGCILRKFPMTPKWEERSAPLRHGQAGERHQQDLVKFSEGKCWVLYQWQNNLLWQDRLNTN